MLVAFGCVTLLAFALIVAFGYVLHSQREERAENAVERRELLERIQRPERVPVTRDAVPFEMPEFKPDVWARIGDIGFDPNYGLEDDGNA